MTTENLKQRADSLAEFLKIKTGIDYTVTLGSTGEAYTVQGPLGTMLFWLSQKEQSIVYMIDVLADAPSVVETVLSLAENGFDLTYSGPYTTHHMTKNQYVFGAESYDHKGEWLKIFASEIKPRIVVPS